MVHRRQLPPRRLPHAGMAICTSCGGLARARWDTATSPRRRWGRRRLQAIPARIYTTRGVSIVVFRSNDGNIRSLYWTTGAPGVDDLSGYAHTPKAAGEPAADHTPHNDTHQVVYRAADGHLYELFWVGVAPVRRVGPDLRQSGAPAAASDPGRRRQRRHQHQARCTSCFRPTAGCTRSGGYRGRPRRGGISRQCTARRRPRIARRPSRSKARTRSTSRSGRRPITSTS